MDTLEVVAPGLYTNEKRMAIPFVFLTTGGFLLGAAFNHYIAFPFMMKFFASFNTPDLAFMPKLEDVFGLYTKMLLGMGVVFQMPTVVYFLAKLKLITARFLASQFKYALLIIFVLAAVITPTGDMMTQAIFAAPMLLETRRIPAGSSTPCGCVSRSVLPGTRQWPCSQSKRSSLRMAWRSSAAATRKGFRVEPGSSASVNTRARVSA